MSADIIAAIRAEHRKRCFAMEQRKRVDLALGAFLRLMLGWRKDMPAAERKAIADAAMRIMEAEEPSEWSQMVSASQQARAPFEVIEKDCKKQMERLAAQLPAWTEWGASIRGFGAVSLAVIVGEAGDLSLYANKSKLWKRMGLAVIEGVRQGGLRSNAGKEDWIAHGYSPLRRSRVWNIGDALIKGNRDGVYRQIYLQRKAFEHARDPEMSKMHAHRRAQRYMEKRLLHDLWKAWRRTNKPVAEMPIPFLSAAKPSELRAMQRP